MSTTEAQRAALRLKLDNAHVAYDSAQRTLEQAKAHYTTDLYAYLDAFRRFAVGDLVISNGDRYVVERASGYSLRVDHSYPPPDPEGALTYTLAPLRKDGQRAENRRSVLRHQRDLTPAPEHSES